MLPFHSYRSHLSDQRICDNQVAQSTALHYLTILGSPIPQEPWLQRHRKHRHLTYQTLCWLPPLLLHSLYKVKQDLYYMHWSAGCIRSTTSHGFQDPLGSSNDSPGITEDCLCYWLGNCLNQLFLCSLNSQMWTGDRNERYSLKCCTWTRHRYKTKA